MHERVLAPQGTSSWHLLGGSLASVQRESPPELHVIASVGGGHPGQRARCTWGQGLGRGRPGSAQRRVGELGREGVLASEQGAC